MRYSRWSRAAGSLTDSRLVAIAFFVATWLCIVAVAPALDLPAAYRQWLDQDVHWIITPEERTAYLHLSHSEERDEFIKQFWELRNPTPGGVENPFKSEHYRRLAYANVNFAASKPGWQTDFGRIYIVAGPPDKIRVKLSDGGNPYAKPTVIWHYRSNKIVEPSLRGRLVFINGKDIDITFVDICRCGDYRLITPDKVGP